MYKELCILLHLVLLGLVAKAQHAGSFTDTRDGATYITIKIGDQIWMAENMAYKPDSGNYRAYDNDERNLAKYGYLYDWQTAVNVCPSGWHLPSINELETLLGNVGGEGSNAYTALTEGGSSGFNALFGGWWNGKVRNFDSIGYCIGFWSSTQDDTSYKWDMIVGKHSKEAYLELSHRSSGFSVRCLQD